jgi:uncharacterized protein (DUF488 family)
MFGTCAIDLGCKGVDSAQSLTKQDYEALIEQYEEVLERCKGAVYHYTRKAAEAGAELKDALEKESEYVERLDKFKAALARLEGKND